jgi:hypothetical protein
MHGFIFKTLFISALCLEFGNTWWEIQIFLKKEPRIKNKP